MTLHILAQSAGYLLQGIVALLAHLLGRRRYLHRIFAWYAILVAVVDPIRAGMRLAFPYSRVWIVGRILMLADPLLFVSLPMGLAVTAASIWSRKIAVHVLGASMLVAVVLARVYPYGFPERALLRVEIGSQMVIWGCFIAELLRRQGTARRDASRTVSMAVAIYGVGAAVFLLGPYAAPEGVFAAWEAMDPLARPTTLLNLILIVLHLVWIAEAR